MLEIKIECEGLSPFLMNPATDELLEELRTGVRAPRVRDLPPEKEAEKKLIKQDGKIGIPAQYLYSCLIEAGRYNKLGKKQISTKDSSLIPSFLWIKELFFPFSGADWKVDMRRGRLPDGTAVCIVRPRFDRWEFSATLIVDEKQISEENVRNLLNDAGSKIGLGDFRPSCKGPFGRFRIIKWKKA